MQDPAPSEARAALARGGPPDSGPRFVPRASFAAAPGPSHGSGPAQAESARVPCAPRPCDVLILLGGIGGRDHTGRSGEDRGGGPEHSRNVIRPDRGGNPEPIPQRDLALPAFGPNIRRDRKSYPDYVRSSASCCRVAQTRLSRGITAFPARRSLRRRKRCGWSRGDACVAPTAAQAPGWTVVWSSPAGIRSRLLVVSATEAEDCA